MCLVFISASLFPPNFVEGTMKLEAILLRMFILGILFLPLIFFHFPAGNHKVLAKETFHHVFMIAYCIHKKLDYLLEHPLIIWANNLISEYVCLVILQLVYASILLDVGTCALFSSSLKRSRFQILPCKFFSKKMKENFRYFCLFN